MFGYELKGTRDILTREVRLILWPGKIGQQPQTFCSQEPKKALEGIENLWSEECFFFFLILFG